MRPLSNKKHNYSGEIILIGEKNSPNLGDSVICHMAEKLYQEYYPNNKIVLWDISAARHPITKTLKKIEKFCVTNKSLHNLFLRYYSFFYYLYKIHFNSVVCFVGGAVLQDYFCEAIASILNVANIKKSKVFFHSVGIGPLSDKNIRRISFMMSKTHDIHISLRDNVYFFSKNIYPQVHFSPDIAIMASRFYNHKLKNDFIGWGVINTSIYNESNTNKIDEKWYIKQCSRIIEEILSHDEIVMLFTNGDYSDYMISEQIYKQVKNKKNLFIAPRPTTDKALVSLFQNFKFIISSRLHSLILSYAFNIPFIALSWDKKVNEFTKSINHDEFLYEMIQLPMIHWQQISHAIETIHFDEGKREELSSLVVNQIKTFLYNIK